MATTMRFSASAAATAAAAVSIALSAAFWGGAASAQSMGDGGASMLGSPGRSAGFRDASASGRVPYRRCRGEFYPVRVVYPQGFDGGGPVDRAVRAWAEAYVAEARATAPENMDAYEESHRENQGGCGGLSERYYDVATGSPHRVSSRAASVLFSYETDFGGIHPAMGFVALNLASDGRELAVRDLFPDPAGSLPLLWARIFRDTCRGHDTAPSLYGSPSCSRGVPPLPEVLSKAVKLEGLGNAYLTGRGLSMSLNPYDGWSFAEGGAQLDFSRNDLAAMGAAPGLWGR
ncbi:MAG: hypothetical protein LBQ12_12245 [Deltaproteobacteria bacterium]|jgi:hypothetical protein|nr:hypothetical protein [Deltaproteobacteria bacterium]